VKLTAEDVGHNTASDTFRLRIMDTTRPIAVAGDDMTVRTGTRVTLDASRSSDNVGISNFTWQLVYEGRPLRFHDRISTFLFEAEGTYIVLLKVKDADGNEANDTMVIKVKRAFEPPSHGGLWIIVLVLLAVSVAATLRMRHRPR
jgi:hypothetical protein